MTGKGALGAGWLLIIATAVGAGIGIFLGDLADLRFLGGLAGGVIGTICGFVLVWRVFVIPANDEVAGRDYSGIRPLEDEDDDDDSW